jgi:hypothetical protein
VLLLNGGLQAFAQRYAFLTADGLALHPDSGSHFYPSHVPLPFFCCWPAVPLFLSVLLLLDGIFHIYIYYYCTSDLAGECRGAKGPGSLPRVEVSLPRPKGPRRPRHTAHPQRHVGGYQ